MWALLILLSIPAYLYVGFYIGDKSIEKWGDNDNESVLAKLLFPFNAQRGTVGEAELTAVEMMRDIDGYDATYRGIMSVMWPLKVLWNISGIALFGGPGLIKQAVVALAERRGVKPRELLPQAGDDLPALYGKMRDIDEEIRGLLTQREIVEGEIDHQKIVLEVVVETEEAILDRPEIPQLTDGGEELRS